MDRSVRQSFTQERAIDLLDRADAILAEGGLEADVCRQLSMSHVVYKRLRARYGATRPHEQEGE